MHLGGGTPDLNAKSLELCAHSYCNVPEFAEGDTVCDSTRYCTEINISSLQVKRCGFDGYVGDWRFNGADLAKDMKIRGGKPLWSKM